MSVRGRRVVAVDGPAASGKTTLAYCLAAHFGLDFLDTGLLYRAVAWELLQAGKPCTDTAAAAAAAAGRDIGTVVRPDASHKIFVTANVEERAKRRCNELQALGVPTIYDDVLAQLQERDARDRSRAIAPLVPASDAFVIDTTDRDIKAAFEAARDYVAAPAHGGTPAAS